jgi:hypothetical protein
MRDFDSIIEEPNPFGADWIQATQANAHEMNELLDDPSRYEARVVAEVARCRSEGHLRPLSDDDVEHSLRASR